jgi:riboflavin kinase/FMN adenylyltransferase
MKTVERLDALKSVSCPIAMAIGFFDGVHRGHLCILRTALQKAEQLGGEAWVLTFDPHPARVLAPDRAPPLLTSHPHKLRLIEEAGVRGCVVLRFTPELAAWSPESFLQHLQDDIPALRSIVVGANWRFGRGRAGHAELLKKESAQRGWEAVVVQPELYRGLPISSTRIRDAVRRGQLDEAGAMLGRRFSICGTVVPGKKVGRRLGYPTINLDPHNEVCPPPGIYAVWADVQGRRYGGAAFLADLPQAMAGPSGFLLEVHLLDFQGDVYGQDVEVVFVRWIRESQSFASPEALRWQIARDVEETKRILAADGIAD